MPAVDRINKNVGRKHRQREVRERELKPQIKIYYCFQDDIMCIVEGNKIYKYIGDYTGAIFREYLVPVWGLEVWYKAKNHPDNCLGFVLIGTL